MGKSDRKAAPTKPRRIGSIQHAFVGARSVSGDVLLISAPKGGMSYVGVLEVAGITYDLHSDDEQARLNDLYHTLLCGLSFDIQILWRSLPLQLDRYLEPFEQVTGKQQTIWETLAGTHARFMTQLSQRKNLLKRQVYVIVRFSPVEITQRTKGHVLIGSKQPTPEQMLERARYELTLRLDEIERRLDLLGLPAQRLGGLTELARFYQSCLQPMHAQRYPIQEEVLASIDAPTRCLASAAQRIRCPACYAEMPAGAGFCGKCGTRMSNARPRPPSSESRLDAKQPPKSTPGGLRRTLFTQLPDFLAPHHIEVTPDCVRIGNEWHRFFFIVGLPRTVVSGWLRGLFELDEPVELSFTLHPQSQQAMDHLFQKKQVVVRANRQMASKRGEVLEAHLRVAEDDLQELSYRVSAGEERMFDLTWVVRVWGASKKELNERAGRVENALYSTLLAHRVCEWEQAQALQTALPHVRRHLEGNPLLLSAEAVSTTFPFVATSFFHEHGVLEGITPTGELIVLDPWNVDEGITNANRVVFGPPGQGKSHYVKTLMLRQALRYSCQAKDDGLSFQMFVVDPDREYGRMAAALGGQIIRLAPGSPDCINPFDLPQVRGDQLLGKTVEGDLLADRIQQLHRLLEIMLANKQSNGTPGTLTQQEDSALDLALYDAYKAVGITRDPSTHDLPPPVMRDLTDALEARFGKHDPLGLVDRLKRYVDGSLAGMFQGQTTLRLDSPIVVFDTHDCETDIQRIIALFLVSNFVWSQSFLSTLPRQLIVDEAASLIQYPSGKQFLEDLVRRARKNFLGVTTITQHPDTFAQSNIIANSAIKMVMRPDPSTLDLVRKIFHLSEREGQAMLRMRIGEGLLLVQKRTSEQHMIVLSETSELEHLLATTNPREIAEWLEKPEHADLRVLLHRLSSGTGVHELASSLS